MTRRTELRIDRLVLPATLRGRETQFAGALEAALHRRMERPPQGQPPQERPEERQVARTADAILRRMPGDER